MNADAAFVPIPWRTRGARTRAIALPEVYTRAGALVTLPADGAGLDVGDYLMSHYWNGNGSATEGFRLALAIVDQLERRGSLHALGVVPVVADDLAAVGVRVAAALRATAEQHERMRHTVAPTAPGEAQRLLGIADGLRLAADVLLREVAP